MLLLAASAGSKAQRCEAARNDLLTNQKRDETARFCFKIEKPGNYGPSNGGDFGTASKLAGTNSEPVSAIRFQRYDNGTLAPKRAICVHISSEVCHSMDYQLEYQIPRAYNGEPRT